MNNRKLKHKNRQGFTLVELLVVIAILAVLASVSVVGYLGFVKKARVSNDTGIVTQMNTTLQANEVVDGANTTAYDAFNEIDDAGLDVNKLSPTTQGYYYAFDISQNRVFLLDETYNQVAPENYTMSDRINVFVIAGSDSEVSTLNTEGFSSYLKNTFTWSDNNADHKLGVTTGIDVGSVEVKEINYTSTKAQNVTLRTSGGKLTINDTNDASHQYHYGYADKVEVATGNNCYEGHALVGEMKITEGKVIAAKDAYIGVVEAKAEGEKAITLEQKDEGTFVIPSKTSDSKNPDVDETVATSIGYTKSGDSYTISEEKEESTLYKVYTEDDLKQYRDLVNSKNKLPGAKLMNNITLTDEWTPIAEVKSSYYVEYQGKFDGNNKTIYNMRISKLGYNYAGFFGRLGDDCVIKDLNLVGVDIVNGGNYCGGLAGLGQGHRCLIQNCTIDSTSKIVNSGSYDVVGGLIGTITVGKDVKIENCINYATIENQTAQTGNNYSRAGGIVGQILGTNISVTIENCKNYGSIKTNNGYPGGIVGTMMCQTSSVTVQSLTIKKCYNSSLDNFDGSSKGNLIGWLAQSVKNATISIDLNDGETVDANLIGTLTFSDGSIKINNEYYVNIDGALVKQLN